MPVLRLAQADREEELCLVCRTPGHERAARNNGLCAECSRQRHDRGQTIEAFVAGMTGAGRQPRRSFGRCMVDGCRRWAITDERLCGPVAGGGGSSRLTSAPRLQAVPRRGAVAAAV